MVLAGLLGFAQAQNNSNDTRKAPQAANPTEQRGPGGPGGRGTLLLAFKHPDLFCAASSVAGAVRQMLADTGTMLLKY